MSCRSTALSVFFLLFLLRVQRIDLTHARSLSFLSDFDFPEIDGSAVDDTCMIFSTANPTETENTPPPLTPTQVVATTEKPAVQTPPTKDTGTPIKPQPALPGQNANSRSELAARLLTYLLANSRGHGAVSWNRFFSKPVAWLPHYRYGGTSDSDESASKWLKNKNGIRWRKGLFPSEDSSDEN